MILRANTIYSRRAATRDSDRYGVKEILALYAASLHSRNSDSSLSLAPGRRRGTYGRQNFDPQRFPRATGLSFYLFSFYFIFFHRDIF